MANQLEYTAARIGTLGACLIAVLSIAPVRALADAEGGGLKTRFIIDDADPESNVPSPQEALSAPLQMGYWVMLVSERAEAAAKRGDLPAAIRYYRALATAAPDRAVGYTRMCTTYEAMGDWTNAVASCGTALEKQGVSIADHEHFVRVLLSKPEPLVAPEIARADAVIAHLGAELAKLPAEGPDAPTREIAQGRKLLVERLKCELGARLKDRRRLQTCTHALRQLAPRDPSVIAFAFALALVKPDFDEAERVIAGAKRYGVNQDGVALMRRKLRAEMDQRPIVRRMFDNSRALSVAGLCLAMLLAGLALLARRRFGMRTV